MVELIAAVAILGILSTSLGVVGVVMFKTMGQTQDRLTESRGPRFASVYWVPDVASADTINPVAPAVPTICGAAGPLVTLQWTDTTTTGVTTVSLRVRDHRRGHEAGATLLHRREHHADPHDDDRTERRPGEHDRHLRQRNDLYALRDT